tara:strand:+ start:5585 stop:6505 length:921 start_codon:yes stop_codon:yes gene_type:complete
MTNIKEKVGKTPLVKLSHLSEKHGVELYGKCEFMNPSGSVKDRAAYAMIHDALDAGLITKDTHIIEPTSGNTGIALAFICASLGIKLTLTMPESMSLERRQLLKAYGAHLDLTPAHLGMTGAIQRANELKTDHVFIPQQFENQSNPNMHYQTTGPEILSDIDVDVFVAGVGTGGTISGVSKYLKEHRSITAIAVEPKDSPVISGGEPGPHMIQGIGAGFIPKNFDRAIIDEILTISNDEAMQMASYIATNEGLLCGISAGANVHAALEVAKRPENLGKNVVTILCDSGERYLSMNLFNGGNNETTN